MEETVKNIQTLNVDEWTYAYEKEGGRFFAKAESEETADKAADLADYQMAQRFYYMGRWPSVRTESRSESYKKERMAFAAVERLRGINMEEISYSGNGYEVVGLLVKPKENSMNQFPLLISIGGLDGWKEARISQLEPLLDNGVAIFSLDMPGTGQSGVKFNEDSVPSLLNIIHIVLKRADIDPSRVFLYGGSFGGYWTTRLAASGELNLLGYVDHSGPYAETFEAAQLNSVFDGDEYLYDSLPAFCKLFDDINGRDELFVEIKRHTIDKELSNQLSIKCLVLVVGGTHDSLVPVNDLLSVFQTEGGIREFWLNPKGAGAAIPINLNFDAIQNFVVGKTIKEIEFTSGKSDTVDAVSGATLEDTANYLKAIAEAAHMAKHTQAVEYKGDSGKLKLNVILGAAHGGCRCYRSSKQQ